MHLCQHFSSDHKYAFEADLLIVSTYSTAMCTSMCFMQSPGSAGTALLPDETCPECSLQTQPILRTEPGQVRPGTPEMHAQRLSTPALFHFTDPIALPCHYHVPVLPQQPGGEYVHHPEFPSCPSLPGCQVVAWSKSAGSHQVRKIHRRVTKLKR